MENYDLIKYSSNAVVAGLGIVLYDVMVDNRSLMESFTQNDVMVFALSNVALNFSIDVLSALIPYLNDNNMVGMASKHLL